MSSSPTSLSSSEPEPAPTPFDALGDLVCPVTVVLGTGSITVRQCLSLARQTVLRLDESAGDDLTVVVNGISLARGEVAIIDTTTAIRVTDLSRGLANARRGA